MRRRVINLTIAFISFQILLVIGHFLLRPGNLDRVWAMDAGWDVSIGSDEYTDVSLAQLRKLVGNGATKGERIVLTHRNVDLSRCASPTIMFETRFSAWRLYCDGEELRNGYIQMYDRGEFVGCDINFVSLPVYKAPVTLELELLVTEDGAYSYYEAPVLGDFLDLVLYVVYHNIYIFLTSAFLIIFGLVFFAIAVGFKSDLPEINMQVYSALLFIVLGVWFLTQFKVLDLFVLTFGHQTEMEYISLYLLVPIMYLVMGCMQNYLKNKVFLAFSITSDIIAILPIFLHFAGMVHINRLLPLYQVDALTMCVFMVVMLVRDTKAKRITPSQIIQLTGQATLAASFIFNVIFYYMEVAGISEQIMMSKKAVPMGTMCMVFATLVNYEICITESFARKKEYDSLAHLAYADGLTGIPNRSSYEKYLNDLSETDEDYCLISIDLNRLKTVNDKQGHLMGDKYLREFVSVLEECFRDKGFTARIGGDEFVAVLRGEIMDKADAITEELNKELHELNEKDPSINRSAACGYAFRHEVNENDWNSVYLLADERMYVNKKEMKAEEN